MASRSSGGILSPCQPCPRSTNSLTRGYVPIRGACRPYVAQRAVRDLVRAGHPRLFSATIRRPWTWPVVRTPARRAALRLSRTRRCCVSLDQVVAAGRLTSLAPGHPGSAVDDGPRLVRGGPAGRRASAHRPTPWHRRAGDVFLCHPFLGSCRVRGRKPRWGRFSEDEGPAVRACSRVSSMWLPAPRPPSPVRAPFHSVLSALRRSNLAHIG